MFKLTNLMVTGLFWPILSLAHLPLKTPSNPQETLNYLLKIEQDNPFTFFCKTPLSEFKSNQGHLNPSPLRATAIMPAFEYAQSLACYSDKLCITRQGNRYKGLRCCYQQSSLYRMMLTDLHNLILEGAFFNAYRKTYAFGLISKTKHKGCQLYIDKKNHLIEPPSDTRGQIARAYLYMHETYRIPLSPKQQALYQHWHQQYPPQAGERQRNQKIKRIQGNSNPYLD